MPVLVSTEALRSLCDPLENNPWGARKFKTQHIDAAIAEGQFNVEPWSDRVSEKRWPQALHIRRIAHLAVTGWKDAIELDIGVPNLGCYVDWPILDGNHRFAAALYRGDLEIWCSVSGDVEYGHKLFNLDITEPYNANSENTQ